MKNVLPILIAVLLCTPVILSGQDRTDEMEEVLEEEFAKWKKHYAAPSYGMGLMWARVNPHGAEGVTNTMMDEKKIPVFMADLRILSGTYVTRRGGFYTGLETGAIFYLPFKGSFDDAVAVDDTADGGIINNYTYTVNVQSHGGVVFLMSKYGYRFDTGASLVGMSWGLELGFGGGLYMGEAELWIGNSDLPEAEVHLGSQGTDFVLVVEGSGEISFRLGPNFRLFGKAGVMMMPTPPLKDEDVYNPIGDGNSANSDYDYKSWALTSYDFEHGFLIIDARAGFALNFNL
jgi:hypothetical protein